MERIENYKREKKASINGILNDLKKKFEKEDDINSLVQHSEDPIEAKKRKEEREKDQKALFAEMQENKFIEYKKTDEAYTKSVEVKRQTNI